MRNTAVFSVILMWDKHLEIINVNPDEFTITESIENQKGQQKVVNGFCEIFLKQKNVLFDLNLGYQSNTVFTVKTF